MFDKRVILYSFTKTGSRQQLSLMEYMKESGIDCRGYTLERFIDSSELLPLQKLERRAGKLLGSVCVCLYWSNRNSSQSHRTLCKR